MSAAKHIFIVEDQRLIAADLEMTLRRLGYHVVGSVASGEEAVPRVVELRPDLVLLDIRLRGEMDGIQAAEAIRAQLDVAVVYLTAYADEETILRARGTSAFGYVVKPFNERELRAAIEIALYKQRADRRLAEEHAKRRAAEEVKLLVQGVKDYAIFMLDPTGRVASWNEGAMRINGYASEEILGRQLSTFYTPEDVAAGTAARVLERALRDGHAELEGWRVRKDGSRFWANVVITPIRDEAGRLLGFGKVARDLTERKRADRQREQLIGELEQAVRSRDEFLQIASHELRTPLTPLRLQLEAIARALAASGMLHTPIAKKLEVAMRQTIRLSRLVESLLDVSRITARGVELDTEPLELGELVRSVAEGFCEDARRAGSDIDVQSDEAAWGEWDRRRIEQILSSLITNAIKYGLGKPIEIDTRVSDDAVRVSVTDHGMGIDPVALARIFGRFERAVSVRNFGGLGLGLFVARGLAEAHGGTIAVRSKSGGGSTFTVVLPRKPVAHVVAQGDGRTP